MSRTKSVKLLFCIKGMDTPGGGAERVLAEVASALVERGHDVYLLSFDDIGGQSFYDISPAIRRICIGSGPENNSSKPFRILRQIVIMRRVVLQLGPDVVVGFMNSAFIPLGLALLGTGMPMIASEHTVPQHYRGRPLQAALLYLTPYLATKITCVSEQARRAFSPFFQSRMVVLPNPLTLKTAKRADVAALGRQQKTVLAVGRMDNQKDHKTLVSAFALIADDFPDWHLRIVGDGERHKDLEAQIAAAGLADRVCLPGATDNISSEYEAAQLYVQPSRYESYGLTVIEALGHGLPAVGFDDCLGVNGLIRHGENGLLVDGSGDRASALAEGLRNLISDTDLRIRFSNAGMGPVEDQMIGPIVDRWESLLSAEVVSSNQGVG